MGYAQLVVFKGSENSSLPIYGDKANNLVVTVHGDGTLPVHGDKQKVGLRND